MVTVSFFFREEKEEILNTLKYARLSNWLRQEGIVEEDDFNVTCFFRTHFRLFVRFVGYKEARENVYIRIHFEVR